MALDPRYIVASDLEQYFVRKDNGLPLSNGTLTFYRDVARNTPKPVYQLSGAPPNYTYTSMGAQITLSAVGTVQNSGGDNEVIYYFPYDSQGELDLYYVVARDSNGIEQFTREAWPNVTDINDPTKDQSGLQNQISNPTFTNVLINEGKSTTYTVTGATSQVFEFAPNWDFVISGTGTVVVQRIALTGNDNVPTSPPYVIDVNVSTGITQCFLRQRFPYNSGLWSSTGSVSIFLAGSYVAKNQGTGTVGLQMFYVESSGGSPVLIVDGTFPSTYTLISGSTLEAMPQSNNTNFGKDGYIDIYLSFNASTNIRVSAVQVIPTASNSVSISFYDTDSSNRNEAYQGDYYIPRLNKKTAASYLVGWDFPLNPFQFGLTGNIANAAAYIADQTIGFRGATGNVAWAQSPAAGVTFTTAGTNDAFYLMQYLSGAEVKAMLGNRLSVNAFAYQGSVGDAATMRIYLYRGGASAAFPVLPISLGTVATTGVFTLTAASWTEIPRSGLDTAQATLSKVTLNTDINNGNNDYGFSGWEITDAAQIIDTDKFAIVVTFHYPDTNSVITVNSISLTAGDIPCRPNVKTPDETLRECQYYYEKSYEPHVTPGTNTPNSGKFAFGLIYQNPGANNTQLYPNQFELLFKQQKRIEPTMKIYCLDGTPDGIRVGVRTGPTYPAGGSPNPGNVSIAIWLQIVSTHNVLFTTITASGAGLLINFVPVQPAGSPEMYYHYTADARLGIV